MKKYMTRVVLHNCDAEDYELLHTEMEAEGFARTITGDNGVEYHLPHAEYYKSDIDTTTAAMIRTQAIRAAQNVINNRRGKSYAVLVTGPNDIAWSSLERV